MSLNISNLTAYVDEQRVALIRKMVLGGRSTNFMTIVPDVKSSVTLNTISTTLSLQSGSCGFLDQGTTDLNQNTLTVCPIKLNESICIGDVETVYLQYLVAPGSYAENFGFEQIYAEDKVANISSAIDTLIWQGDVASVNPSLALCDGLIKYATTTYSGDVVNGNVSSATAITANNIVALVDDMVASTPVNIIDRDDLFLFMGYDTYRLLALAYRNQNLFHYTGAESQGETFSQMIPGTNVRAVAVKGLNGTNKMFLTAKANLAYGCDLVNDYENLQIFWSNDNQEVRTVAKFKMGVQANFWDYVVYFEL
jgi:hypothetical protein